MKHMTSCRKKAVRIVAILLSIAAVLVLLSPLLFPSVRIIVCRYRMDHAYSRLARAVAHDGDGYAARQDYTYFRNRLRELGFFTTRVYRPAPGSASDTAYAGMLQRIHADFGDYPHMETLRTRTRDGAYAQTFLVWDVSDRIPGWDRLFQEYYGTLGIPLETIITKDEVGARPIGPRSRREPGR